MDDPDGIMLRFLRARKWSTSAGVAMVRLSLLPLLRDNTTDVASE